MKGAANSRLRRINIEISNICNLGCSFCPEVKRDKRQMTPAELRHVLEAVGHRTDEVCLHLMGEPTFHPEFPAMVAVCSEFGIPVNLSTNGLLLRGPVAEAAMAPVVRQLNISLHSYVDNFPDRDPSLYISRVFEFLARAEQARPDLYVNLRLWDLPPAGASTSKAASSLRQALVQYFEAVDGSSALPDWQSESPDPRRRKNWRLRGRIYLHFDSRFTWPSLTAPYASELAAAGVGTCKGLSGHVGIHADGTVVPCCLDKEAVLRLGNIHEQPLDDILQSDLARRLAEGFQRGELREELCRRCSFITRFERSVRKWNSLKPSANDARSVSITPSPSHQKSSTKPSMPL